MVAFIIIVTSSTITISRSISVIAFIIIVTSSTITIINTTSISRIRIIIVTTTMTKTIKINRPKTRTLFLPLYIYNLTAISS